MSFFLVSKSLYWKKKKGSYPSKRDVYCKYNTEIEAKRSKFF